MPWGWCEPQPKSRAPVLTPRRGGAHTSHLVAGDPHAVRLDLCVSRSRARSVVGRAIDGEGPALDSVEESWEPAVVPVCRGCEYTVLVLVGALPGEPECGEFFDDLGMVGPAGRDAPT
jgi:hypothetical protein